MSEGTQRRLAAIVAADVAGYSRLIGLDEEGTLATLKACRQELIDPLIAEHGGRIVKTMGDGLLLEFPSVVNAVKCSIEVQEAMAERNATIASDRGLQFRVGINLGDIVSEGGDIYGDGVNVAARLQEIAEIGGIAISRRVHEDVQDRLEASFEDVGEQALKNISRPVQVWRWRPAITSDASRTALAEHTLALPDKPSIAVLPFDNMSGDPEQEFFADGIAEDVITELSRFRSLRVIARNSTFTYKGQPVNVQAVGRELGSRYVVEGSVRTAANRVRVTAQLIDAPSGEHLWADRYDRDLTDIFAVQDEITRSIVTAIAPEVLGAEDAKALRKAPENLSAWECVVRANAHTWNITRDDFVAALALYDRAISLDPNYAAAHSGRAFVKAWNAFQGWGGRTSDELTDALSSAQRALALDVNEAMAHYAAGFVHMMARRSERAIEALQAAINLNPNFAEAYAVLGTAHAYAGVIDSALEASRTARQLNPRGPFSAVTIAYDALAHFCAGQDEQAVRLAERSMQERQDLGVPPLVLTAALGQLGRIDEAHDAAAAVRRQLPRFSLARHERRVPIVRAEDRARYIEGLRKAGLPE